MSSKGGREMTGTGTHARRDPGDGDESHVTAGRIASPQPRRSGVVGRDPSVEALLGPRPSAEPSAMTRIGCVPVSAAAMALFSVAIHD